MQDKTTGILLVATGHPYYARMAYNMLVSIRYHDKDIPVAIAHDGEGFMMLDPNQRNEFNHVIRIPVGSDPYRSKLSLDEYTIFDNTLYLDVDMIFGPNKGPKELLSILYGREFQCVVRGSIDAEGKTTSQWIDPAEVKEKYGFESILDISSEVIYFEGKPKIFDTARKFYKKCKVVVKNFGAGKPDEAYLTLAIAKDTVDMIVPFEPSYWQPRYFSRMHSRDFIQDHFLLSVGGAFHIQQIKNIYDSLLDMYFYHSGMPGAAFQLQPKSRVLKERRAI